MFCYIGGEFHFLIIHLYEMTREKPEKHIFHMLFEFQIGTDQKKKEENNCDVYPASLYLCEGGLQV